MTDTNMIISGEGLLNVDLPDGMYVLLLNNYGIEETEIVHEWLDTETKLKEKHLRFLGENSIS
jgi:hypothetical protein